MRTKSHRPRNVVLVFDDDNGGLLSAISQEYWVSEGHTLAGKPIPVNHAMPLAAMDAGLITRGAGESWMTPISWAVQFSSSAKA